MLFEKEIAIIINMIKKIINLNILYIFFITILIIFLLENIENIKHCGYEKTNET